MVKASIWIQVRDCCNWAGELVWNIWVKTKQLQIKEIRMPAMAISELDVLAFQEKKRNKDARSERGKKSCPN